MIFVDTHLIIAGEESAHNLSICKY